MRLFDCPSSGERVFFRNLVSASGVALLFDPEAGDFVGAGQPCANRERIGCNWLAEDAEGYCRSCAMTTVIPDLGVEENLGHWADAELAKRWVLAGLARWGWFTAADPGPRPEFRLLSEATAEGRKPVMMGHAEGVVTLNVTEADPASRIARREALGERFRTMIGHVRHELAHVLFERLAGQEGFLPAFRARFGDERADYGAALEAHYEAMEEGGAPRSPGHVTRYAAAHPHEDWAETCAHMLHLVDMADSAAAAGVGAGLPADPYAVSETDWPALLAAAVDLGIGLNHVNRSLGLPDLYPFVLTDPVREKLAFAHRWLAPGPAGARNG